jgi:hypothetical protein
VATRRERVVLELEDNFTAGAARAAVAAQALRREIDGINGSSSRGNGISTTSRDIDSLSRSAAKGGREIDRLSGRLSLLATAGVTLGPALLPIGAAAVPAITAIAGGLGAAAGAVGVAMLAFNGLGDALKAMNDYELDPTAANLEKLRAKMGGLAPAARQFADELDGLRPILDRLQATAGAGMFPGLAEGLNQIRSLAPEVNDVVARLATEMGTLATQAGSALKNDADWQSFFGFIRETAAPTLDSFARATGNVVAGLGSILVAFRPMSADFTSGLLDMSRGFREWAANLSGTAGFQDFVSYISENGPRVGQFLGAIADAMLALVKAAAPWGAIVLPILTDVAKVFTVLADSPIGPALFTAAAGMMAISRATSLAETVMTRLQSISGDAADSLRDVGDAASEAGDSAESGSESTSGLASSLTSLAETAATLAVVLPIIGAVYGKLYSLGSTAGDLDKLTASAGKLKDLGGDIGRVTNGGIGGFLDRYNPDRIVNLTGYNTAVNGIKKTDQALAQLVSSGNAEKATEVFAQIADAAKDQGVSLDDVRSQFPLYAAAAEGAKAATDGYSTSTTGAAQASRLAAVSVDDLVKSMQDQRNAALGAFDAETQWRQAVKDAAAQAKESNAGVRGSSDAALKNRQALSGLAAAWNNQSDAVKNSRARFHEAKNTFIETAKAMGVPEEAARRLARQVLQIPKSKVIKTSAETNTAQQALQHLIDMAAQFKDKSATFRLNYIVTQSRGAAIRAGGGRDGDPSTPYWSGGYTGKGDKYEPAGIVHRGEFVFSADATKGHERELAMLQKRLRGYARGGPVGNPNSQLFGLGTKGWSDAEIGGRISNLTVRQIHAIGSALDDLNKKQLRHLAKALDKATDLQEKQTSAAKDALDAVRSRRSDLSGSVASGLTRNLWEGQSGGAFSSKFAAGSIGAANAQLRAQIADSADFTRLEGVLANRGVTGPALQEILSHGGIGALRMAAASSNSDLRTYQQLYGQAQSSATHAGTGAGTLVYGAQESRALAAFNTQSAELRAIKHEINLLRREQKGNAKHTGEAAAHGVNKSAGSARSRRR